MNEYYTNVALLGDNILYRGIKDGVAVYNKIKFAPTLYIPTTKESKYKTLEGETLGAVPFDSVKDAKEFIKSYRGVDGFKFYGMTRYMYQYIHEEFKGDIEWNLDDLNVTFLDIECECEKGFPDIETANEAINLITIKTRGQYHTFGCEDYDALESGKTLYYKCDDEKELLERFLDVWTNDYPDIVTGWNVQFFDMIYLSNRIEVVLGKKYAKKLSPWNIIRERRVTLRGQECIGVDIYGIATMDYLDLYKRYTYVNRENYKLGHIAHVELKAGKIDYSEYGSLHLLYKENWKKFVDYNIKDVELVVDLDEKLKLIELSLSISYDAKINFEDAKSQVRIWDTLIYNHLADKGIQIPQNEIESKDTQYAGAYVKDPITGFHKWVVSFDVTSLYPSLILALNLSPETIMDYEGDVPPEKLKENELIYSANNQYFRKDIDGFLPELIRNVLDDRVIAKKQMAIGNKNLELIKNVKKMRKI